MKRIAQYSTFLILLLGGCALFQKAQLSAKPLVSCSTAAASVVPTCNEAVDVTEKANILTASVNDAIYKSAFVDKTMTKDQAVKYRDRTKTVDNQLDHVYDLLQTKDFSNALIQATITKALIDALNREVVAQIAKGAK